MATYAANANAYNAGGFVAINGDCDVSVFLHESCVDLKHDLWYATHL